MGLHTHTRVLPSMHTSHPALFPLSISCSRHRQQHRSLSCQRNNQLSQKSQEITGSAAPVKNALSIQEEKKIQCKQL